MISSSSDCSTTSDSLKCNSAGKVVRMNLWNMNLGGTIPNDIGKLTALEHLYFDTNRIQGTIPRDIGKLTALTHLGLYANDISGTIPGEVGLLTNLLYLYLYENNIDGVIPDTIGALTAIPTTITKLTSLIRLNLNGNRLLGDVPEMPITLFNCELQHWRKETVITNCFNVASCVPPCDCSRPTASGCTTPVTDSPTPMPVTAPTPTATETKQTSVSNVVVTDTNGDTETYSNGGVVTQTKLISTTSSTCELGQLSCGCVADQCADEW
eukprot:CAMPEP_0168603946 /NCGR_PEP_ID=MMETSP0420-20121227/15015_1 /TAXON_ID=498008 /ORGANISM="Pessonella sp." /LENGTH=267 /DNA_ID=CAMNT_0008642991 /DNA_START=69 /DNA_END=869 /DNA_ORIENTATION=+